MRILPARAVDAAGRSAFLVRVVSATDSAYLEVISARDTFAVIAIQGTGLHPAAPGGRR